MDAPDRDEDGYAILELVDWALGRGGLQFADLIIAAEADDQHIAQGLGPVSDSRRCPIWRISNQPEVRTILLLLARRSCLIRNM